MTRSEHSEHEETRAYKAGMASGRIDAGGWKDSIMQLYAMTSYREDARGGLKMMHKGSRWYTRAYVAYLLGYARGFREVTR